MQASIICSFAWNRHNLTKDLTEDFDKNKQETSLQIVSNLSDRTEFLEDARLGTILLDSMKNILKYVKYLLDI